MTTKILPVLLLFLLILYVFSAVDLAIAGSLILAAILFKFPAVWLFSAAFLSFASFLISLVSGTQYDFIADLSVTSYVLFAAGLALLFIRGEKQGFSLTMPQGDQLKALGVFLLAILVSPLIGVTGTVVLGYGAFLLAFSNFRSHRWSFLAAIAFLLSCPIFLIARQDNVAIQSAILAYSFLIIGVFQILAGSKLVHPL